MQKFKSVIRGGWYLASPRAHAWMWENTYETEIVRPEYRAHRKTRNKQARESRRRNRR